VKSTRDEPAKPALSAELRHLEAVAVVAVPGAVGTSGVAVADAPPFVEEVAGLGPDVGDERPQPASAKAQTKSRASTTAHGLDLATPATARLHMRTLSLRLADEDALSDVPTPLALGRRPSK
jgi:hypothetical protein